MTSKLTKEQAEDTIEGLEGLISRGIQSVYLNIALSGMRQLLAAMDGEPVAYTDGRNLGYIDRGRETAYLWGKQNTEVGDIALYRHAQQPVVPDGYVMVPKVPTERMVIDGFESEPDETFSEPEVWEAFQKMSGCEQAAFRARLCWAAMLAAAPQLPGSEPATVPGKWIPVSERMPEERETVVLVADERGIVWCAEIQDGEIYPDEFPGTRGFGCAEATHWMPLPAAPQEVK
nr:DUF551 domain-containing protein [Klebsiella michiganensis]